MNNAAGREILKVIRWLSASGVVLSCARVYVLVLLCGATLAFAQENLPAATEDTPSGGSGLNLDMKLEDLVKQDVVVPGMSTPVNTVERQSSTVGQTPAAVFVITPEMIKRSGARCIPDVLRMAPGVDVARIDAHSWAISIRGFNSRFANKLLVQIDGRVVYNASFGGVWWDIQDVMLADVERIEVIRGPGTTMWGSNAVNGVINILTKNTSETQGALVQSGAGVGQERNFNTIRYGGGNGEDVTWRVWGQQFDRAAGWSEFDVRDAWHVQHGGFRIDYTPTDTDQITLQGDIMNGVGGQSSLLTIDTPPYLIIDDDPTEFPAGNILFHWAREIDEDTSWQWQAYYDRYQHNTGMLIQETREQYDIDFQYQFRLGERHHFVAGANYRSSPDRVIGSFQTTFTPQRFTTEWAGVFLQDTMTLEEDRWFFTLGTRLEYNTFGGLQAEPTARLLFTPNERRSVWAAVSRAARNPTRAETQQTLNNAFIPDVPLFFQTSGNPNLDPENLVAYEIGYRAAPTDEFTWDIAGYINDYNKLIGIVPNGPPFVTPPGTFFPSQFANATQATTYGCELTATCQLTESWRFFGSYSVFEVRGGNSDPFAIEGISGSNPHNQVYLQSSWDLGDNVQLDLIGRYVDALTALQVPRYFQMDARLGWQATKNLEISFVGQNLLDSHHPEFADFGLIPTQVRRSWYGMLTWSY